VGSKNKEYYMKEKRNLSGIYFRYNNENIVFEELSEEEQDKILDTKDVDFIKRLTKMLATTIREIGEEFDIKLHQ